ncbi:MAG: hypothetical protein WA077_24335, partial [Anaerolineae bacterium]
IAGVLLVLDGYHSTEMRGLALQLADNVRLSRAAGADSKNDVKVCYNSRRSQTGLYQGLEFSGRNM